MTDKRSDELEPMVELTIGGGLHGRGAPKRRGGRRPLQHHIEALERMAAEPGVWLWTRVSHCDAAGTMHAFLRRQPEPIESTIEMQPDGAYRVYYRSEVPSCSTCGGSGLAAVTQGETDYVACPHCESETP